MNSILILGGEKAWQDKYLASLTSKILDTFHENLLVGRNGCEVSDSRKRLFFACEHSLEKLR